MSVKNSQHWARHDQTWRDPISIVHQSQSFLTVDAKIMEFRTTGRWWQLLDQLKIRLLVSREYEHLLISVGANHRGGQISYMGIPHPSGIAVDLKKKLIYVASTRNPNQIYTFSLLQGSLDRSDIQFTGKIGPSDLSTLIPTRSDFYPGSLYIHDLCVIGQDLYANAVGHNSIVKLLGQGRYRHLWWPKSVDQNRNPRIDANYLQLNSIAPMNSIQGSFFSASAESPLKQRPGQLDFPVDGRGVIFSGKTRKVICRGLTRPHSVRVYQNKIWVDNSGYGEFGYVDSGHFRSIASLPGWTRGLCINNGIAFIGVSRVIPKYSCYAPGLKVKESQCGVFAIELKSGKILGSLIWPRGNQIFAIESVHREFSKGFLHDFIPHRRTGHSRQLFYSFQS